MVNTEEPKDNSIEIEDTSNLDLVSSVAVETDKREKADELEQLTKQVVKGGGTAFIGSSIGKVAVFGLHILLGRVLGPGTYGLYALGTSVTGIAQSIASLGVNKGIVRYGAMYQGERDKARVKGTILSALGISLVASALIAFLLFIFAGVISERFFNEPGLTNVLKVFALALPFYVLTEMTAAFAQSFKRIEYQQGINLFRSLANLGLVGLAFLLGFRLAGAMYGFLISGVLSAGLGFYLLWKIFPEILLQLTSVYNLRRLLRFSIPTFLAGFSYFILNHTDRIMLGYFSEANEVGIYNAAAAITMLLTIILTASIAIMSPTIADLYNRDKFSVLSNIYQTVTRWIFTLTLPLFLIFAFVSRGIMSIFGSEFSKGALVLIILSAGQLVNAGTGPVGNLLEMTGKQDVNLVMGLILVVINIALNIWLIPLFGATGAALATAISNTLIFSVLVFFAYKVLRIKLYDRNFIRPMVLVVITTMLTAIAGKVVNLTLFNGFNMIEVISIILFYSAGLLIFGLSEEDRLMMALIKSKILSFNK